MLDLFGAAATPRVISDGGHPRALQVGTPQPRRTPQPFMMMYRRSLFARNGLQIGLTGVGAEQRQAESGGGAASVPARLPRGVHLPLAAIAPELSELPPGSDGDSVRPCEVILHVTMNVSHFVVQSPSNPRPNRGAGCCDGPL